MGSRLAWLSPGSRLGGFMVGFGWVSVGFEFVEVGAGLVGLAALGLRDGLVLVHGGGLGLV